MGDRRPLGRRRAAQLITTGDHPIAAISRHLWAIVGMDCVLLLFAVVAVYAARRLGRSALTVRDVP